MEYKEPKPEKKRKYDSLEEERKKVERQKEKRTD